MSDEGGDGERGSVGAPRGRPPRPDWLGWVPVAKKEFRDTVRSRLVHVLGLCFAALFVLAPALVLYFRVGRQARQAGRAITTNQVIPGLWAQIVSAIVPVVAIGVTYAAVAGERERGSLKVLLSLPYSRAEIVTGKVLGRWVVVGVPLAASLGLSVLVFLPSAVVVEPAGYLVFAALTAFLAVVFVGFAVGVSAWARTTRAAMFGTVGPFVYLLALWNANANGLASLLSNYTGLSGGTIIRVQLFLKLCNPAQAYQTLLRSWVTGQSAVLARASMFGGLLQRRPAMLRRRIAARQLGEGVPLYLSDAAAVAVLFLWLAVPLYLGYRAFERRDL